MRRPEIEESGADETNERVAVEGEANSGRSPEKRGMKRGAASPVKKARVRAVY